MTSLPLVTVITPSYNQGPFLEATILSVLGQSYPNIEFIILDAESNDETPEILERYRDRVSHIIVEPDGGQSDAIVKGFRLARGELVGWINSDDVLYPGCVARIVDEYRRHPDTVLFYNSVIDIITADGSFSRRMDVAVRDREYLLRRCNTLVQPGSFYRRDAVAAVGYLDTKLRFSMDLDLWLRLLKVGSCVNLGGDPIAGYREWLGTKTSTGHSKLLRERKRLLVSHGARATDKTVVAIYVQLLKCFLRKLPYLQGLWRAARRRAGAPQASAAGAVADDV